MGWKDIFCAVLELIVLLASVFIQILEGALRWIIPSKRKNVEGEIVLVTGAGSGIGRLISIKFAELGAIVVCSDINPVANKETVEIIKKNGGKAHGIIFDCSDREEVYEAAKEIRNDVGNVTILVNNAGISTGSVFEDCSDRDIEKTMNVNTLAAFWTTKAFLPHMKKNNHGHIVNIASAAGLGGTVQLTVYCASKFAVIGFSEALALELIEEGKDNVICTYVAPYFIDTGMFAGVKTRFPLLFPVIKPEVAAQYIVDGVRRNELAILIPRHIYVLVLIKWLLPVKSTFALSDYFGFSKCMKTYVGRGEKTK